MLNNTIGFQTNLSVGLYNTPQNQSIQQQQFTFFGNPNQSVTSLSKHPNRISIRSFKYNKHCRQRSEDIQQLKFDQLEKQDDHQNDSNLSWYLHRIDKNIRQPSKLNKNQPLVKARTNIHNNRYLNKAKVDLKHDNVINTIYSQIPFECAYQSTRTNAFNSLMNIQKTVRLDDQSDTNNELKRSLKTKFSLYNDVAVMDEPTILKEYRLRLPTLMDSIENPNNFIHINEGFHQSYSFIESIVDNLKKQLQTVKQEEQTIKQSLVDIDQKSCSQMDSIKTIFQQQVNKMDNVLKQNFVRDQNQNFTYQKTITQMKKDNLVVSDDIGKLLQKLRVQEKQLYGLELFELETDDPQLIQIQKMNLRKDMMLMGVNEKHEILQHTLH